jgi:hypothetical protein
MTGGDIPIGDFSYTAGETLTSSQFAAMKVYTDGTVKKCGTGDAMMGILQDNPASGKVAVVRELGHSKALMYSTGTKGDALKVADSSGRLGTASLGSDVVVAIALESWTATGQIIAVALTARTAQGATSRSGQLVFTVPMVSLGTSGATTVYSGVPMGFAGSIADIYAIPTKVASSSGATAITLTLSGTGNPVTGLSLTCSNANCKSLGTVMTSTKATVGVNSFVAVDTLTITSTPSVTFATDSGMLEIHIVTN